MRNLLIATALLVAVACTQETQESAPQESQTETTGADALRVKQTALIDRYFEVYKAKDVEAMLALYDDGIFSVLYPTTMFGRGIEAARGGVTGDFESRPNAWADMPHRYRLARDKWLAFGSSVNGDERAPLWILFDFDKAGEKIEATYTQIAFAGFIEGASVDEPTEGMRAGFDHLFSALKAGDFAAAAGNIADDAALFSYPPADIENHLPVITGASDVASVLSFKWGEKAWRDDTFVSQYMQYVFVGIPGEGIDRVALFTFGADPSSPDYELIVRVDVMGPSGG